MKVAQLASLKQKAPPFSNEQIIPLINAMGYEMDHVDSVKVTEDEIIIALAGKYTYPDGYWGSELGLKDVSYKRPFAFNDETQTSNGYNPLIVIPLTPENRHILAAIECNQFTRPSFR